MAFLMRVLQVVGIFAVAVVSIAIIVTVFRKGIQWLADLFHWNLTDTLDWLRDKASWLPWRNCIFAFGIFLMLATVIALTTLVFLGSQGASGNPIP